MLGLELAFFVTVLSIWKPLSSVKVDRTELVAKQAFSALAPFVVPECYITAMDLSKQYDVLVEAIIRPPRYGSGGTGGREHLITFFFEVGSIIGLY